MIEIWSVVIVTLIVGQSPPQMWDRVGTFNREAVCEQERAKSKDYFYAKNSLTEQNFVGICHQTWMNPDATTSPTVVPPVIQRGSKGNMGTPL